jgi:hypothetical protein
MRELYWVSVIIQDKGDKKPWSCSMSTGDISFKKAMATITSIKANHIVLSAWIDVFDINGDKRTVFHECYIDAFGNMR